MKFGKPIKVGDISFYQSNKLLNVTTLNITNPIFLNSCAFRVQSIGKTKEITLLLHLISNLERKISKRYSYFFSTQYFKVFQVKE